MRDQVIVIGKGIVGQLCALAFAKKNDPVNWIAPDVNAPADDRPLILLAPALAFLKSRLPEVFSNLVENGAYLTSHRELCRERFQIDLPNLPDGELQFLACRSSFLSEVLQQAIGREKNIESRVAKVTGLLVGDRQTVRGVSTTAGEFTGTSVVEVSGVFSQRAVWMKNAQLPIDHTRRVGTEYCSLLKFYQSKSPGSRAVFEVISDGNVRGGIYPQDRGSFAISFSLPSSLVDRSDFVTQFQGLTSRLSTADNLLKRSQSLSEVKLISGLYNMISDFYERPEGERVRGFFPLGDAWLTNNPVYGRNITMACLHIEALLHARDENDEISWQALKEKMKPIEEFWKQAAMADLADSRELTPLSIVSSIARRHYARVLSPLLKRDPEFYNDFLRHYQMQIPAAKLFTVKQHLRALGSQGKS